MQEHGNLESDVMKSQLDENNSIRSLKNKLKDFDDSYTWHGLDDGSIVITDNDNKEHFIESEPC